MTVHGHRNPVPRRLLENLMAATEHVPLQPRGCRVSRYTSSDKSSETAHVRNNYSRIVKLWRCRDRLLTARATKCRRGASCFELTTQVVMSESRRGSPTPAQLLTRVPGRLLTLQLQPIAIIRLGRKRPIVQAHHFDGARAGDIPFSR